MAREKKVEETREYQLESMQKYGIVDKSGELKCKETIDEANC